MTYSFMEMTIFQRYNIIYIVSTVSVIVIKYTFEGINEHNLFVKVVNTTIIDKPIYY